MAAGLQLDSDAERLEPLGKVEEMLFGQDFSGSHEGYIVAAFEGH